jgi:hypothetical protein
VQGIFCCETRGIAVKPEIAADKAVRTATLEAFADTIVPGEKRSPDDRAIAGVSEGGGAVAAGAVPLLETDAGGMEPMLDDLATALNAHAVKYREEKGLPSDDSVPAFVSLDYDDRITLLRRLLDPEHPEKQLWAGLAMFSNMAFDTNAHMHTVDAIRTGQPGLLTVAWRPPDEDGIWRFPNFSYRRQTARVHPDTDPITGSLA